MAATYQQTPDGVRTTTLEVPPKPRDLRSPETYEKKKKCEPCRRAKKKCHPEDRIWPVKCQLCVAKGFPCTPPTLPRQQLLPGLAMMTAGGPTSGVELKGSSAVKATNVLMDICRSYLPTKSKGLSQSKGTIDKNEIGVHEPTSLLPSAVPKRRAVEDLNYPSKHQKIYQEKTGTIYQADGSLSEDSNDNEADPSSASDTFAEDLPDPGAATVDSSILSTLHLMMVTTPVKEQRLKAAADFLAVIDFHEEAYLLYHTLDQQAFFRFDPLDNYPTASDKRVCANLVWRFFCDIHGELRGPQSILSIASEYEVRSPLINAINFDDCKSMLFKLLLAQGSAWMWRKKVANVLGYIETSLRAEQHKLDSEKSQPSISLSTFNTSRPLTSPDLMRSAKSYYRKRKSYERSECRSTKSDARFQFLQETLTALSSGNDPMRQWGDEHPQAMHASIEPDSFCFVLYRLVWIDLYGLRLGPASAFSTVKAFEDASGFAIAELAAVVVGLAKKYTKICPAQYSSASLHTRIADCRQQFGQLARYLLKVETFEEHLSTLPNLDIGQYKQHLLEFITQETKVNISSVVERASSKCEHNKFRVEELVQEWLTLASADSQSMHFPEDEAVQFQEFEFEDSVGTPGARRQIEGNGEEKNERGATIENRLCALIPTLAPSITSSRSSFRGFKLSTEKRDSVDSYRPQLPSTAILKSQRSSDWSMISDLSRRFSRISVASMISGVSH